MSNKAECPACKAYLSGVWDAREGEAAGCPSCGLPGSVIAQVYDARKAKADADLTRQLEEALVRAGKAEHALYEMRRAAYEARQVFADWERKDPFSGPEWQRVPDWDDD